MIRHAFRSMSVFIYLFVLIFRTHFPHCKNLQFKHTKINDILYKVILWKVQFNWRIFDRFIAAYGRPTLKKWVNNGNVNGHLGAPDRHLIVCARRKISDVEQTVVRCWYCYRTQVYNWNYRGLKMEILISKALAAPPEIRGPKWSFIWHRIHYTKT